MVKKKEEKVHAARDCPRRGPPTSECVCDTVCVKKKEDGKWDGADARGGGTSSIRNL